MGLKKKVNLMLVICGKSQPIKAMIFYEINNPKFINKVAVSILVDISGSQNKENTGYGEKLKSLVLGLSNALDSVHVKHEIIGYHAPICQEMRAPQYFFIAFT